MADGSLEIKNASSQASLGLSVEHGGDFVPDQRMTAYSRTLDGANYKSVMVTDNASQHQSGSFCGWRERSVMSTAGEVAVLRIELQGIEPLIWRRIAVSTSMTLTQVHRVVQ